MNRENFDECLEKLEAMIEWQRSKLDEKWTACDLNEITDVTKVLMDLGNKYQRVVGSPEL